MLDISKLVQKIRRNKSSVPVEDCQLGCYNRVMTQGTTIVCRINGLTSIESCKTCQHKNKF